jgi:CheY-like chemotaxis protein
MARTVLIVDDDPAFRAVARELLEADGDFTVTQAASGAEARTAVAQQRPDVVVLDIGLPSENGFAVCRALHELAPTTAIVLCSVREAEQFGDRVTASPAVAFLAKAHLSSTALSRLISPGPSGS